MEEQSEGEERGKDYRAAGEKEVSERIIGCSNQNTLVFSYRYVRTANTQSAGLMLMYGAHARTHARTHARMHAHTHTRTHACTHTHTHRDSLW